jgi:putative oxidoreductase
MKKQELAATLLRVMLGVTFLAHGWQKVMTMGLGNVAGWFESIGLPSALAYAVGYLELFGGLLVILGLGTRWLSWAFAAMLVGATVKVKLAGGFLGTGQGAGYELDLALIVMALFFAISGSTGWGVDTFFRSGKETPNHSA